MWNVNLTDVSADCNGNVSDKYLFLDLGRKVGNDPLMAQHEPLDTAPLYLLREELGLSIWDLSRQVGISRPTIYEMERGQGCTLKLWLKVQETFPAEVKKLRLRGEHFFYGTVEVAQHEVA